MDVVFKRITVLVLNVQQNIQTISDDRKTDCKMVTSVARNSLNWIYMTTWSCSMLSDRIRYFNLNSSKCIKVPYRECLLTAKYLLYLRTCRECLVTVKQLL